MDKRVRIGMAQINPTVNDFSGNADLIEAAMDRFGECVDVVVFPELALSGYYPHDLIARADFLEKQQRALDRIMGASRRYGARYLLGYVMPNEGAGKPFHNSVAVVRDGRIEQIFHKQLLPTYDVFDERRHFEPGPVRANVIEIGSLRLGVLICEDAWGRDSSLYKDDPVANLASAGVDVVITVNASPSEAGKEAKRKRHFASLANEMGVPFFYLNQTGGNDQIVFDGGSFAIAPNGRVVQMKSFEADEALLEWSAKSGEIGFARRDESRFSACAVRSEGKDEQEIAAFHYNQIVTGLKDYARKCGFSKVVIGSSGGIDSALTIALARDALGSANVASIAMPSRYSSEGSVNDARQLAANLGVDFLEYPIRDAFNLFRDEFSKNLLQGDGPRRITIENLQARIRGTILMAYSNQFGALLLSTGNKSEMAVGYATLYGDMNGGLNLIGDLYKTEVYALANWFNAYHEKALIPQSILDKAPSAELFEGQRDSDTLPPYPVLDDILRWYIEAQMDRQCMPEVVERAFEEGGDAWREIERVIRMVDAAEYKRRQAPPIIRVSSRAFGFGRQLPIAAKY